jgi:hypothetical protein
MRLAQQNATGNREDGSRPPDPGHDAEQDYVAVGKEIDGFIAARRRGEGVTVAEFVLRLPEERRELARECLEVADLFLSLG